MTIEPETLATLRAAQKDREAFLLAKQAATIPSWNDWQAAKAAFLAVAKDPNVSATEKMAKHKALKELAFRCRQEFSGAGPLDPED